MIQSFRALASLVFIFGTLAAAADPCGTKKSGKILKVAKSGGNYSEIQPALNQARPGDTVRVQAGVYKGGIQFPSSGSATAGCIFLEGSTGAVVSGSAKGISIQNKNYIAVVGMTVQNQTGSDTPTGIAVSGSSSHIEIRNNLVHHVVNSNNAHGISFYGTSSTAMSDLLVTGNEIRDCKLGSSESMVFNGNVTDFVVSHNIVHDNDNIGIDFIGFEGVGPAGKDQARNGVCTDNLVYNITSAKNPAYGGERAADGIYVDGGRNIVIERNVVRTSDIGIEVASEHSGKVTEGIVIRNNFVSGSFQGNVMIGGYDSKRGKAKNISVLNNTLVGGGSGEIVLQYYSTNIVLKNNILFGKSGQSYLVSRSSTNQGISVRRNLYFGASKTSPGAFRDPNGIFSDPRLVRPPENLHLTSGSPATDSGEDLGGALVTGATDVDGEGRLRGRAIDIGADEF